MAKRLGRRDFAKQTVAGTAVLAGASTGVLEVLAAARPTNPNKQIVAALGPMFIPSKPGDPGYAELEPYGISDFVMGGAKGPDQGTASDPNALESADHFPIEGLAPFNTAAQQFFDGKSFLELDEKQCGDYLTLIIDGSKISDADQKKNLQAFYRAARARILSVYYRNFPLQAVKRNADGEPILHPGDTHQITNPNVWKDKKLVTGWDIGGFKGPMSWEDEEQHRALAKKTHPYWYEEPIVTLNPKRPPAAAAIKTSDGHDYCDVIVLGGGTAGCMVAGRLAERGINPKTGDRLRIAMIEGGQDWTIRDPGVRPGYGYPVRRRMITNIPDGIGPEGNVAGPAYRYTNWSEGGPSGYNFKLIGGCSNHYGGTCWIPGEEEFHFYREASGVDWDLAKFGDAIQEVREMFHASAPPDAWWSKADHMWADAGRTLGLEMRSPEISRRNGLGASGGTLDRYDSKGTALPWAYIGMNNGLKIIPNAEVQKIIIEKVPGGRPVARGAIYTDKAGAAHEVRAARVIVACAANWTPLLLYQSGYGPKEFLGDKLLVENKNVGYHMDGDLWLITTAYLEEPIHPEVEVPGATGGHLPFTTMTPRPWGELTVAIHGGGAGRDPVGAALGPFAPQYGWDHKEYIRNGAGSRHIMSWYSQFGAVPWSWRVMPSDGRIERFQLDTARVDAAIKQTNELVRAWHTKLPVKVVKADLRQLTRPATVGEPQHRVGTARAGASRDTSVCTSDFDCHDIDNLLFTSSATVPRAFFWSLGPTAVNAAYGYRRMLANHFSTGCSTKGFA